MVTGDLSCKRRMKDRLWYGDCKRRRGVCKVFVRRDSLMIAVGRNAGRLPRETWVDVQRTKPSCWTSSMSKITKLSVKLKPSLRDKCECQQRRPR